MDPLTMAAVMAGSQVLSGVVGNMMSQGDKDAANAALAAAFSQFSNLNIPDTEKMKLALNTPEVQGILNPYMQQAEQLGPSAYEGISVDPRLKQTQMDMLNTLSKMGTEGLTAEDRANLNAMRRQAAADEQSRQQSILQQMAQRGIGGSGVELASRIASSQAQADRAGQESDRLAAMIQRRMLEGAAQSGSLAGNIRQQEYGEQSDLARARDYNQQFNLGQRASTNAANIAAMNAAQQANLANKQRIHEIGVNTRNQQQQYNKQLQQQAFENEMALRQARAAALAGQGQAAMQRANQTAGQWVAGGNAIAEGIGAYNTYNNAQRQFDLDQQKLDLQKQALQQPTYFSGWKPTSGI